MLSDLNYRQLCLPHSLSSRSLIYSTYSSYRQPAYFAHSTHKPFSLLNQYSSATLIPTCIFHCDFIVGVQISNFKIRSPFVMTTIT